MAVGECHETEKTQPLRKRNRVNWKTKANEGFGVCVKVRLKADGEDPPIPAEKVQGRWGLLWVCDLSHDSRKK